MKPAHIRSPATFIASLIMLAVIACARGESSSLGVFSDQTDIGIPPRAGSAKYDPDHGGYTVSGGGGNMWFTNDSFHYLWKQISGDLTLAADIQWSGTNGNAHRK